MALSATVTVPYGRSFGGTNQGARYDGPVAVDNGLYASDDGSVTRVLVRVNTCWFQSDADLSDTAQADLVIDMYLASIDRWCRQRRSSYRAFNGSNSQMNFVDVVPTPTVAGRTYLSRSAWATMASGETDALMLTLSSEGTPGPAAGPTVYLGETEVTKVYLGSTEVAAVLLG